MTSNWVASTFIREEAEWSARVYRIPTKTGATWCWAVYDKRAKTLDVAHGPVLKKEGTASDAATAGRLADKAMAALKEAEK